MPGKTDAYFDFYGIFGRKIAKNCDFLDIESGIISTFFQSLIFAISYQNNAKLSYFKKKQRKEIGGNNLYYCVNILIYKQNAPCATDALSVLNDRNRFKLIP